MKKRVLSLTFAALMLCAMLIALPIKSDATTLSSYVPHANIEYSYSANVSVGTVRYMSQIISSNYFYDNYWGAWKSQAGIECGTCSISMSLSYIGVNKTAKDILDYGKGTTYFGYNWGGAEVKSYTYSNLSTAVDQYIQGNGKYSPPIIHLNNYSSAGHFVVLVGHISSNEYQVLDPANTALWKITINGSSARYTHPSTGVLVNDTIDRSGRADDIYQWHNPGATPSVIVNNYPSYCAIKTTQKTYIKSLPCSKASDPNSTDVETASKGTQYQAIGLVENKFGNLWYKVKAKNGSTGYIYAGDTKYMAHSISDIKGSGITAPTTHTQGNIYLLTGTVSSTYNQLTQVSAYIYAGNSEQGPKETGGAASVSGNSYSLKNSTIDNQTAFSKLPVGIHTYVVWASYKNYYAKSATTIGMNTGETAVYKSTFTVTKGTNGGTQTDRTPLAICDEVVGKEGSVYIRGWAFDPDTPSESVAIHVYIDRELAGAYTANTSRPDVNNVYGCGDNHGFSITVPYNASTTGTHSVEVFAINTTYGKDATGMGPFNVKISAHTHSYSSQITAAASCTTDGVRTYTCTGCSASYTEKIAAHGHIYVFNSIEPTCTEKGRTNYTCYYCEHKYSEYTANALGHSWKNATCTAPKTCTTCGTTSGSANGHSWKNATCTTPKYCTTCGTTSGSTNGHSWKNATCTTAKTCSTCGATSGSANGHSWKNGVCTICGESYEFAPTNLSMVIGNTLQLYLWVPISDVPSKGCYADFEQITETGYRSIRITQKMWIRDDDAGVWKIPYSGVAAKEMTDQITMTVYDASGKQLTKERKTTIESYALSQLSKTNSAELKTVLVDMLNYGAEAQKYFGYKEKTLANANLTKSQKKYATASVKAADNRKTGGNITASLSLENSLEMNFMVRGDAYTNADYAVVTLTNHYGEDFSFGYTLDEKQYNGATVGCITVDLLAVADAKTMVLCEVYDINGNRLTYCDYSIETYVARMSNAALADINDAIMKFGVSAYNYFH